MYTISQVEAAILERLKSQIDYVVDFGSISYHIEEWEGLTTRTPAIYVEYARGSYDYSLYPTQDRTMQFTVYAIVTTQSERQYGEKGVYELLDDIRGALSNSACGLTIDPLLPTEEAQSGGSESVHVYGITFETRCRYTLS